MRVLIIGAGGVGSAVATIAATRQFAETIVVADIDDDRAQRAAAMADDDRVSAAAVIDASNQADVEALIRHTRPTCW
jgi:saccharopine dehydrogenase (NAD+, L-lysine forming)